MAPTSERRQALMAPTSGAVGRWRGCGRSRLGWRFLLKIGQLYVGDGPFGRVTGMVASSPTAGRPLVSRRSGGSLAGRLGPLAVLTIA